MGIKGVLVQELQGKDAAVVGNRAPGADGRLSVGNRVEGKKLQVLRKSFVKPASETPSENRWLPLSNLDLNWLKFYTPLLCVYRELPWSESHTIGEHLRKSLEKALTLFYPLAGRVVTSGDEQAAPGILCSDAGAVFVEACIDAELDELQYENNFQPSFLLSGMAEAGLGDYPRLTNDPAGRPALIVQMTRFKCGGITLASNWAHAVADGFSGFHFMKSWAELGRGEEVSLLPVHDRALVKARKPLILSDPFSEHYSSEFSNISGHDSLQEEKLRSSRTVSDPKQTTVTVQVVEITKQLVDDLKREADNGASTGSQIRLSTVCVVSAHLWRVIVKARGLPGTDLVRFWTLIEGRKKLSLPAGYFGNVISSPYTTTTVSNLLNKPLAYSARLIAATIQNFNKDWFQNLVDWWEAKQVIQHPGQRLGPDHECGSSWQNRFPYYELDFGFGVPVCSMRNADAAWDGLCAILPSSKSPDNFTAIVYATPDVMKRFLPLLHDFSLNSS